MLKDRATRKISAGACVICALLLAPSRARADVGFGGFGFDPNTLVSDAVVKSLVNFVAFGTQDRPYEPATPLGLAVGLDFSIEATLFKIPDDFFQALSSVGIPFPGSPIPSLPIAKLHLHKGLSDFFDIGGSFFYLSGSKILGVDGKIVLIQGEEGPTYAFRFCYTYSDISFNGINASTKTFSPQLLMSRQMDFADPYIGVAGEYALGAVDASVTVPPDISGSIPPGVTIPPVSLHKTATAYGAFAFGGVSLRVPRSGLRLTVEGSYNTAGTSSMGAKVGFTF